MHNSLEYCYNCNISCSVLCNYVTTVHIQQCLFHKILFYLCHFSLKEETTMPSSMNLVSTRVPRHSLYSISDSSDSDPDNKEEQDSPRRLTPLEKLTLAMCHDEKTIKELNVGRRVGFYKVCCEIGCGNFSKVKLAFHALTKGRLDTV